MFNPAKQSFNHATDSNFCSIVLGGHILWTDLQHELDAACFGTNLRIGVFSYRKTKHRSVFTIISILPVAYLKELVSMHLSTRFDLISIEVS